MEDRLTGFLQSPGIFLRYKLLKRHPELLADPALDVLEQRRQAAREAGNHRELQFLSEKHALLTACREHGIEHTLFGRNHAVDPDRAADIPAFFAESVHGIENRKPAASPADKIEWYRKLLEKLPRDRYPFLWAEIQQKLCAAHLADGTQPPAVNSRSAIACCEHALEEYRHDVIPVEWGRMQSCLGIAWKNAAPEPGIHPPEQAIAHYASALAVFADNAQRLNLAVTQMNLAIAFSVAAHGDQAENLERAAKLFQAALTVFSASDYPIYRATAHLNLATVLKNRRWGDRAENLAQAVCALENALPVFSRQTAPGRWAMIQTNLGNTCLELGVRLKPDDPAAAGRQIEHAITHYTHALDVRTRTADPAGWAKVTANLAAAIIERADGAVAENRRAVILCCRDALSVFSREKTPLEWANLQKNLAIALTDSTAGASPAATNEAFQCLSNALTVFTADQYPRERLETLTVLADLMLDGALWETSLSIFEDIRRLDLVLRRQDITQVSDNRRVRVTGLVYSRAAYGFARCGKTRDALEWLESGKMQLFRDRMQRDAAVFGRIRDPDRDNYIRVSNAVRHLAAEQHAVSTGIQRPLTDIAADLRTARAEMDRITQRIQTYEPDFPDQGACFDDMAARLSGSGDLGYVVFIVTRYGSYCILLSGSPARPQVQTFQHDTFTYDNLNRSAQAFHRLQSDLKLYQEKPLPPPHRLAAFYQEQSRAIAEWHRALHELMADIYHGVLDDVASHCENSGIRRLVLITHKELNILPLHLACRMVNGVPEYLTDRFEITYSPAFSLIRNDPDAADESGFDSFLGVADTQGNLPGAQNEIDQIGALFKTRQILVPDAGLTPAAFTGGNDFDIIHFSCHGMFDSTDPFNSCLMLTGPDRSVTPSETQTKTASALRETSGASPCADVQASAGGQAWSLLAIMRDLQLNRTKLVVLSACQTGLVENLHLPDEFIGLPAGFLLAGSRAVLSSLWDVPDASACALMTAFYTNLIRHRLPPARALRQAQQTIRSTPEYAGPVFWGAFRLVGS